MKIFTRESGEAAPDWAARRANLLREAQNLKKAKHKNVVEVFNIVEADTNDAIHCVMQFCNGGCLDTAYKSGPLPLSQVRQIATDVAQGLAIVHDRGMLHRDIKPSNILKDTNGPYMLGDFGLVTDNLIKGYASGKGYNDHLAYEVWHGSGTSVRSDIWAFGMTLYRLLHGHAWYDEDPRPRNFIDQGGFANTLRWLPHVPKKWQRTIRKMLNDDPAARYQSARDVMRALAKLPIEPDWICSTAPKLVTWKRASKDRDFEVTWSRLSDRKHQWDARSLPKGAGRPRSLGGSPGVIGKKEALRELSDFFDR